MTGHLSQPLGDLPPWAVMWTLAISIYFASKWLTWRSAAVRNAPVWKHVAYLVAWPGLDAASFVEAPARAETSRCRRAEWLHATGQLACGIVLLFGVARVVAPIGLLFHRAFVIGVVVPFMRAVGALDASPR